MEGRELTFCVLQFKLESGTFALKRIEPAGPGEEPSFQFVADRQPKGGPDAEPASGPQLLRADLRADSIRSQWNARGTRSDDIELDSTPLMLGDGSACPEVMPQARRSGVNLVS